MSSSGGGGLLALGGGGVLQRIVALEGQVSFLKQKVEDDARWKFIVQQWVLDNFGFDIQGVLLDQGRQQTRQECGSSESLKVRAKLKRTLASTSSITSTNQQLSSKSTLSQTRRQVKVEPGSRSSRSRRGILEEEGDDDNNEDSFEFGGNEACESHMEVEDVACFGVEEEEEEEMNPTDLIITPDICGSSKADESGGYSDQGSDYDAPRGHTSSSAAVGGNTEMSGESDSDGSSSDNEPPKRVRRVMDWALVGTFPNCEVFKQQFNMREWGLSARHVTANNGTKVYYYCRDCRKKGPGRLLVKYESEDSEVRVWKNQVEHDHSGKKRVSDEMRQEIINLYKAAGLKDSPRILAAVKLSKPHLRPPHVKQICRILKPFRDTDRKQKFKEKKKLAKKKEKQKEDLKQSRSGDTVPKTTKKGKQGIQETNSYSLLTQFPSAHGQEGNINNSQLNLHSQEAGGREFSATTTGFTFLGQQQEFYQQQRPINPQFDSSVTANSSGIRHSYRP